MDIEKLIIEQLRRKGFSNGSALGHHCGLFEEAATALSTLQAENEKLRGELEQVKRERDASQSLLAERTGVMGAEPITTAFGLALDRLRELAQAELEQVKADRSRYRQIAEVQGRRIDELEKIIQDKSPALDDVPDPIAADERQTSPGRQWDWLLSRFTRRED